MNAPETLVLERMENHQRDSDAPSALARLKYLCPSRYFRFFMFHERVSKQTCWLPEGYDL